MSLRLTDKSKEDLESLLSMAEAGERGAAGMENEVEMLRAELIRRQNISEATTENLKFLLQMADLFIADETAPIRAELKRRAEVRGGILDRLRIRLKRTWEPHGNYPIWSTVPRPTGPDQFYLSGAIPENIRIVDCWFDEENNDIGFQLENKC